MEQVRGGARRDPREKRASARARADALFLTSHADEVFLSGTNDIEPIDRPFPQLPTSYATEEPVFACQPDATEKVVIERCDVS
mmetsp:Transcript_8692/g.21200  ORF Transcript_8692/g.21200 Transcript_8692/m.21200 type:complete len:83 (-) Transcript_8692:58-306(-)